MHHTLRYENDDDKINVVIKTPHANRNTHLAINKGVVHHLQIPHWDIIFEIKLTPKWNYYVMIVKRDFMMCDSYFVLNATIKHYLRGNWSLPKFTMVASSSVFRVYSFMKMVFSIVLAALIMSKGKISSVYQDIL